MISNAGAPMAATGPGTGWLISPATQSRSPQETSRQSQNHAQIWTHGILPTVHEQHPSCAEQAVTLIKLLAPRTEIANGQESAADDQQRGCANRRDRPGCSCSSSEGSLRRGKKGGGNDGVV